MKIWLPKPAENWEIGDSHPESEATVISGGQVGADIAGLRAARACGLSTGGMMPKGFRTLLGPLDPAVVEEYGLREHGSSAYPPRTEENVKFADGTIRFAYNFESPGEKCTYRFIRKYGGTHLDIPVTRVHGTDVFVIEPWEWYRQQAVAWIVAYEIEILNVAGNADVRIEAEVERFLVDVFQRLARRADDA